MSPIASPRTIFLSKLLGLYLLLISLAMFTHRQSTLDSMTALLRNPPVLFVTAVIAMAAGLAMVLGHNVWSGGVLPIVVTLSGWMMLLKAALLLFLSPPAADAFFLGGLHYQQHFYVYTAVPLLLGLYLTAAGFQSAPR
jgi:ribose/xylose/arabinose/galactoside ABC-type transport system permease subunit